MQARRTHPRTRQHAIHTPGAHEVRTDYTVDAQRRRQQVAHHSRKWHTRASGTPVGANVTHMRCARNARDMHLRSRPTSERRGTWSHAHATREAQMIHARYARWHASCTRNSRVKHRGLRHIRDMRKALDTHVMLAALTIHVRCTRWRARMRTSCGPGVRPVLIQSRMGGYMRCTRNAYETHASTHGASAMDAHSAHEARSGQTRGTRSTHTHTQGHAKGALRA